MRAPDPAPDGRDPPLTVSRLIVPRTARYVCVGAHPGAARTVWYGLHGYGQLAEDFARLLLPLAGPDRLLVVPEGLSRFYLKNGGPVGASWMTRAAREDEIGDYVRYLDAVHTDLGVPPAAPVSLLGFSQGAATACRWAAYGTTLRPERVVLWGGDVPPDLDYHHAANRLRDVTFTLVNGTADPYMSIDVVRRSAESLRHHGLAVEMVSFEGGHHLNGRVLRTLAA